MGKVVVLGGNARSGKSTLAYMLVKKGFSRISFDNICETLKDVYDIDVTNNKSFEFFEYIVNKSIEESNNENIDYVIDMYDYLPEDINKLENKDKIEVYFLAYPNCTKEEIKYNVIHYAKDSDWIKQVNKDYLNECVDRFYNRNKLVVNECSKYNYKLINTSSGDDRYIVLNNLLNEIIK